MSEERKKFEGWVVAVAVVACAVLLGFIVSEMKAIKLEIGSLADKVFSAVTKKKQPAEPTPGPLITVEPKDQSSGGSTFKATEWKVEGSPATHGDAGELRCDVIGARMIFQASKATKPNTFVALNKLKLVIEPEGGGSANTLEIEKDASNNLVWKLNGSSSWTVCDFTPGGDMEDCSESGLPPEFFGKLVSSDMTPVSDPGFQDLAVGRMKADHSCPQP